MFALAHETYADLRASALLLEEGSDRQVLRRFVAMHRDESFDRNHAIDEALSQLIEMPLYRFERSYLEIAVRTLTGEHALRNGIVPIFKPTRRFDFDLWVLLINRLGSVHGRLQSDQRDMAAERM